jgi:O-antigen/teichoic acid export membrane protein
LNRGAEAPAASPVRQTANDAMVYGLGSVALTAIQVLLLPVYTRVFTREQYGGYSLLTTLMMVGEPLFRVGVPLAYVTLFFHQDDDGRHRLAQSVWSALCLHAAVLAAVLVAWVAWLGPRPPAFVDSRGALLAIVAALACGAPISALSSVLRGERRARGSVLLSLGQLVLTVALSLVFVVGLGWGVRGAFLGVAGGAAFFAGLAGVVLWRRFGFGVDWPLAHRAYAMGASYSVAYLLSLILVYSSRWFLAAGPGLRDVALYELAHKLGMVVSLLVVTPFAAGWAASAFVVAASSDASGAFGKILVGLMAVASWVALAAALFAREALVIVAGPAYAQAWRLVPWIGSAYVLYGAYVFLSMGPALRGSTREVVEATGLAAVANLAANALLVPRFGAIGAALALLFSFMVLAVAMYRHSHRFHPVDYAWARLGRLAVVYVASVLLGCLCVSEWAPSMIARGVVLLAFPALLVAAGVLNRRELAERARAVADTLWARAGRFAAMVPSDVCRGRAAVSVCVLAVQNVLLFWGHYRGDLGIPWDFWADYYPRTAFWIAAAGRTGVVPQWNPFQAMGLPLALDLQAYAHYLPHRLLALLHVDYTIETAARLHGLHVLLGALGMLALCRLFFPPVLALVGAAAFQYFGGFYSNAEHADITRAFAYLPWLVWASTLEPGVLPRRVVALPILTALLATGGYPGNLIACAWLLPAYAAAQPGPRGTRLARVGVVAAALALGLGMAASHVGPAWRFREELVRHEQASSLLQTGIAPVQLLSLYLSSRRLPGEPSMSSTFVTLPILFGLGLLTANGVRRHAARAFLAILALASGLGDASPWRQLLGAVAPPLAWSRFASSDYRAFVGVLAIPLALEGYRGIHEGGRSGLWLRMRCAVLVCLLAAGYLLQRSWPASAHAGPGSAGDSLQILSLAVAAGASVATVLMLRRGDSVTRPTLLLLLAVCLQGAAVVTDMAFCWRFPGKVREGVATAGDPGSTEPGLPRAGPRPAREVPQGFSEYAWAGNVRGRYLMVDRTNSVLRSRARIEGSGELMRYMSRSWTPILVPAATPREGLGPRFPTPPLAPAVASVEQLSYGTDSIEYRVRLETAAVMIENEMFFPGWTAELRGSGREPSRVEAFAADGALRSWVLPPGEYSMRATFELPGRRAFSSIVVGAWALWLLWAFGREIADIGRPRPDAEVRP